MLETRMDLRPLKQQERQLDKEQRHQQTILDRKTDADEHQAKLLEVEEKTT